MKKSNLQISNRVRKISLRRETLLVLTHDQLALATAGLRSGPLSNVISCRADVCPETL